MAQNAALTPVALDTRIGIKTAYIIQRESASSYRIRKGGSKDCESRNSTTYNKQPRSFTCLVAAIKESFRFGRLTRNKAGYQGIRTTKKCALVLLDTHLSSFSGFKAKIGAACAQVASEILNYNNCRLQHSRKLIVC